MQAAGAGAAGSASFITLGSLAVRGAAGEGLEALVFGFATATRVTGVAVALPGKRDGEYHWSRGARLP